MEADTITPLCLVLVLPAARLKPLPLDTSFPSLAAPLLPDTLVWGKKPPQALNKILQNLSNCGLELQTVYVFTDEQHGERKNNN